MDSIKDQKYLLLDVETTGTSNNDEVIQLAGFLLNSELVIESSINFYAFTVKPISPAAFRVHGITTEKLYRLASYDPGNGSPIKPACSFEQQLILHSSELLKYDNITYICYSNSYFDFKMINQTLRLQRLAEIDFGDRCTTFEELQRPGVHHFDVMGALIKMGFFPDRHCNLSLATSLMESQYKIKVSSLFDTLCQARNLNTKAKAHDALFDAFELMYLFVKYHKQFR